MPELDRQDVQPQAEASSTPQISTTSTMETETPVVTAHSNNRGVKIIIAAAGVLLVAVGVMLLFPQLLQQPNTTPPDPIVQEESQSVMKSNVKPAELADQLFFDVPPEALQIESELVITASNGFEVLTSRISPDGTKVVYTEVSSCYTPSHLSCLSDSVYSLDDVECPSCDTVFRLVQQDLTTNLTTVLFEYSRAEDSRPQKVTYVQLPVQWTAASQSVVTVDTILYAMPLGVLPPNYYRVNSQGVEKIGNNVVFDSTFSYAVALRQSEDFEYGPSPQEGDILVRKNLLTSEETIIAQGDVYRMGELSESGELVYYSLTKDAVRILVSSTRDLFEIDSSEFEERTVSVSTL